MNKTDAKEGKTQLPAICAACVDFRSKPENQKGLFAWCAGHLCPWCPVPNATQPPDQRKP